MLRTYPVDAALAVTADTEPAPLDGRLARAVDDLWRQEQATGTTPLFNGELLSVVSLSPSRIETRVSEYRRFVAQRRDPSLSSQLRVRPLAVSGLTRCRDGIVFGRRAATIMQDAGDWELVPSGGIDRRAVLLDGSVDVIGQLMAELREETGCAAAAVTSVEAFLLVEDSASGVVDIGIDVTLALDAAAVLTAHRTGATPEYDQLRIVPVAELGRFVAQAEPRVVEVSLALLRARGLLEPEAVAKRA